MREVNPAYLAFFGVLAGAALLGGYVGRKLFKKSPTVGMLGGAALGAVAGFPPAFYVGYGVGEQASRHPRSTVASSAGATAATARGPIVGGIITSGVPEVSEAIRAANTAAALQATAAPR